MRRLNVPSLFLLALTVSCAGRRGAGTAGVAIGVVDTLHLPPASPRTAPTKAGTDESSTEVVRPCAIESNEAKAATVRIAAIDAKIGALAAHAPAQEVGAELASLLEGPCFELATVPHPLSFDSGLAVKRWWTDGGKWWLDSQLELGRARDPAAAAGTTHHLVVPPTARKTLTADAHRKSPLLPLLCAAADALPDATSPCGRETLGWVHRAEMAFEHAAEAKRSAFLDLSPQGAPPATPERCLSDATASPPARAFSTYSACLHESARRVDALPLGRYAAPKDGWMVLRGRRGHHGFCDEIRAYDLATGSAYIAKSCGGLVLMQGGSVNGAATGASRHTSAEVGRLPVDAVREAALFILLSETVDRDAVLGAFGRFIPPEIEIAMPERHLGGLGMSVGWSSGRTVLEASWVRGGRGQARAAVHWPDADDAAREHAAELLAIAELGYVRGCAPAPMPKLPWESMGPRLDDDQNFMPNFDDSPVFAHLRAELEALRARPPCP